MNDSKARVLCYVRKATNDYQQFRTMMLFLLFIHLKLKVINIHLNNKILLNISII